MILFAQGNEVDDSIKDFSVASIVSLPLVLTIGIWIYFPFALVSKFLSVPLPR